MGSKGYPEAEMVGAKAKGKIAFYSTFIGRGWVPGACLIAGLM